MDKILSNKVAMITGSSSGIGKALAIGFAKLGADLVLTGRDQDRLNAVKKEIEDIGQKAIAVPADIRNYEEIKNVVDQGLNEFGKIDILINNAGYSKIKPITRLRVSEFTDMIDINIKGVFNGTHAVVPSMIEKKTGSIISTGSVAINWAMASWSVYAMTKSALTSFTTCLAEELKRDKIRVNTVMPNMVHTPMLHAGRTEEQIETLVAMDPNDLVPYYAFLASDDGKKITGMNINVDIIQQVLALKEKLPEDQQSNASWTELEPLANEKLKQDDFKLARKCKKLISFLAQN